MKVIAFIPTKGRSSLKEVKGALEHQSKKPDMIAEVRSKDVPTTILDMLRVVPTEYELVAVADDDAIPPPNWLEAALEYFEPDPAYQGTRIGYVCGALSAEKLDAEETKAQRRIAHVQSSFFGSFVMYKRYKREGDPESVDETRIQGMGVYKREAYEAAVADLGNITLHGWEDKIATWLRNHGYKVIFDPRLSSDHPARPNLKEFGKQIFRAGEGRASYFKFYPLDLIRKPWFLFPSAFVISLLFFPWDVYVMIVYTVLAFGSSEEAAGVPYYFVNHFSYGLGFLYGLFRGRTK